MLDIKKVKEINSTRFNQEKTNELISALKKKVGIVEIEDLSAYLRQCGVLVKVHIGGIGSEVDVALEALGIDTKSKNEECKDFIASHMKKAGISFIPIKDQRKLVSIREAVRKKRREMAIGYDSSFMPLPVYEEFVKYFEAKREEYFAQRDMILEKWDILMENFKRSLSVSLREFNAINQEEVYEMILRRLPTKERYGQSFYMEMALKAFPVAENMNNFDDNIKAQLQQGLQEETIGTLYEIIGTALNDAFESINLMLLKVQENYRKQKKDILHHKTIEAVRDSAKRIGRNNILYNDKIDEIKNAIFDMLKDTKDIDSMVSKAELIQAEIYGYARELEIGKMINTAKSVLPTSVLIDTYDEIVKTRANAGGAETQKLA